MPKFVFDVVRLRMPRPIQVALLAAFIWAGASFSAQAISLQDLADGAEITSSNNQMTFGNFQLSGTGLGSLSFSDIDVIAFENGFELQGTKELVRTALNLSLEYDVVLNQDFVFASIEVSSNEYDDANIMFLEAFDGNSPVTTASWQKYFSRTSSSAGDASGVTGTMSIVESLAVTQGDATKRWSNRRSFGTTTAPAPVPEPNTALMLGLGLMGLAGYARRESR